MVPVERRVSGGVRCALGGPGKSGSVTIRSSRVGPYPPSAAGLQGVQPLVDSANVGKGSRQNGSVPSEEGLAPRTGSVGPCVSPCTRARGRVVVRSASRRRREPEHVFTRSGGPVRGCSVGVGLGVPGAFPAVAAVAYTSASGKPASAPVRGRAFGQRGFVTACVFSGRRVVRAARPPRRNAAVTSRRRTAPPGALSGRRRLAACFDRFHTGRPGRSGREQHGSTPGTPWSDTASGSPSRRCARPLLLAGDAGRRTATRGRRSAGGERSTRNWYGPGESDCLIKTEHRVAGRAAQTRCDFCPVL